MAYRFARGRQGYTDYSSGRVFYGMPGHPAFPIRLASEIFQRCLAIREAWGVSTPCVLYDPCCGGAYHLSTLAYLHWQNIGEIIASDINEQTLSLAAKNLSLHDLEGYLEKPHFMRVFDPPLPLPGGEFGFGGYPDIPPGRGG